MEQHSYFNKFSGLFYGLEKVNNLYNKDIFYKYIKDLFFDFNHYKWDIKRYKKFVENNCFNYTICYTVLNDIFQLYVCQLPNNRGFKLFLKQIIKNNNSEYLKKYPRKVGMEDKAISELLEYADKFLDISKQEKLDFVYDNIYTGLTRSTFRSYCYDGRFASKHVYIKKN